MGVVPVVLRSRGEPVKKAPVATPAPNVASAQPTPEAPIQVQAPEPVAVPKIAVAVEPPKAAPAPTPVQAHLVWNFAVLCFGDLLLLAQLPSWTQGLIEATCKGFFKDLSLYLPEQTAPDETLALPKHQTPSAQDYQDLIQGRLLRAQGQGVKRLLVLMDDDQTISAAVPQAWALYRGPGLQQLMESPQHKQALWSTVQRLRG